MKYVILLEKDEDIENAISWADTLTGEIVFIALTPEASFTLDNLNIQYKRQEDYYSDSNEIYDIGHNNSLKIERLIKILEQEIKKNYNLNNIRPAEYCYFYFKVLFDPLFISTYILKNIINKESPDIIRIYSNTNYQDETHFFSNQSSLYAKILDNYKCNIIIENIVNQNQEFHDQKRRKNLKNKLIYKITCNIESNHKIYNLFLIIHRSGFKEGFKAIYYLIKTKPRFNVLIYNYAHNWNDSLIELIKKGYKNIFRLQDEDIKINKDEYSLIRREIFEMCISNKEIRSLIQENNEKIDLASILIPKISDIITQSILESSQAYDFFMKYLKNKNINALLLSTRTSAIGHTLIQAAHKSSIPIISWQHGGAGYSSNPMMAKVEYLNSDIHFVFGEPVKKSYIETSRIMRYSNLPEFIPVGSSSLDKIQRKMTSRKKERPVKTILYATSLFLKNKYYISSTRDPLRYDHNLWKIQKNFIDMTQMHQDKKFIIKLAPADSTGSLMVRYAKKSGSQNIQFIINEKTIPQLLNEADLVFMDLISTGILETLQAKLPVFICTSNTIIDEKSLKMLEKRAFTIWDPEECISLLNMFLNREITDNSKDYNNLEFLKSFACFKCDGKSAERAVDKLNLIIQRSLKK